MPEILVINPNSNPAVTEAMSAAVVELQTERTRVSVEGMADGPFGIETDDDIVSVIAPLLQFAAAHPAADALVIGCYSDPGIDSLRQQERRPVLGIHESAVQQAAHHDGPFGVIALSPRSIERHARYLEKIGFADRLSTEVSIGMSVAEANAADALPTILKASERLLRDGAASIILGCTGMAAHGSAIHAALGVPVIDPTQAAVIRAQALLARA